MSADPSLLERPDRALFDRGPGPANRVRLQCTDVSLPGRAFPSRHQKRSQIQAAPAGDDAFYQGTLRT